MISLNHKKFSVRSYKVILAGDRGVGKSSIFTRFRDGTFVDDLTATVGLDTFAKTYWTGCENSEQIKVRALPEVSLLSSVELYI